MSRVKRPFPAKVLKSRFSGQGSTESRPTICQRSANIALALLALGLAGAGWLAFRTARQMEKKLPATD